MTAVLAAHAARRGVPAIRLTRPPQRPTQQGGHMSHRYQDPAIRERARAHFFGRVHKAVREAKRREAEERNARTPYNRRAAWRRSAAEDAS